MATMRLSGTDRSYILNHVLDYLDRLVEFDNCPVGTEKEDRLEFFRSITPPKVLKALEVIDASPIPGIKESITRTNYPECFIPYKGENTGFGLEFRLNGYQWYNFGSGKETMRVEKDHPMYTKLLLWAAACEKQRKSYFAAKETFYHVVSRSGSLAQIHRVLPDLVDYLPHRYSKDMNNAMRKSRMPNLEEEVASDKHIENAMTCLAMGHLKNRIDYKDTYKCVSISIFKWKNK